MDDAGFGASFFGVDFSVEDAEDSDLGDDDSDFADDVEPPPAALARESVR